MGWLLDQIFETPKGEQKREPAWLDAFVEFPKPDAGKKKPAPKDKR